MKRASLKNGMVKVICGAALSVIAIGYYQNVQQPQTVQAASVSQVSVSNWQELATALSNKSVSKITLTSSISGPQEENPTWITVNGNKEINGSGNSINLNEHYLLGDDSTATITLKNLTIVGSKTDDLSMGFFKQINLVDTKAEDLAFSSSVSLSGTTSVSYQASGVPFRSALKVADNAHVTVNDKPTGGSGHDYFFNNRLTIGDDASLNLDVDGVARIFDKTDDYKSPQVKAGNNSDIEITASNNLDPDTLPQFTHTKYVVNFTLGKGTGLKVNEDFKDNSLSAVKIKAQSPKLVKLSSAKTDSTSKPAQNDDDDTFDIEIPAGADKVIPSRDTDVYDAQGQLVSGMYVEGGQPVAVTGKTTINGQEFYETADDGDEKMYLKAEDIDGISRKSNCNAAYYNKSGRKLNKAKISKGTRVRSYGKPVTINGKKYYWIAANQYVRASDFD
ncbi:SLAP domain-containing protein [Lactobacillus sp. ESL0681]|uniref:SLAP domain-containing protein n=1 Tax=Lactobacillus sp. ESL0681 TaxID=2983211 RepID=UPI0023F6AA79|nr:SLAP domain-containing protein [Lactobacillus sp. ESL0681]WEV40865.1 SLAP domain-containing protein [Lactobacillus sp. ESL0681]